MSMKAYQWVKTYRGELTSSQLFVLLTIADYYNDGYKRAWPAISTLADHTRLNASTITRCLRRLEGLGLISIEHWVAYDKGTRKLQNRYCLPFYDDTIPNRGTVHGSIAWDFTGERKTEVMAVDKSA